MPSGIINICLHCTRTHAVPARRALNTDVRIYSCVFSNGERVSSADSDQSLLSAPQNRAAASNSPLSRAALPPPHRSPESRCRLLTALQSRAAASSRPQKSRCCLQLPSLQGRARCRLLSTPPSLLSEAHDTPSPLPHKVHNVMSINR